MKVTGSEPAFAFDLWMVLAGLLGSQTRKPNFEKVNGFPHCAAKGRSWEMFFFGAHGLHGSLHRPDEATAGDAAQRLSFFPNTLPFGGPFRLPPLRSVFLAKGNAHLFFPGLYILRDRHRVQGQPRSSGGMNAGRKKGGGSSEDRTVFRVAMPREMRVLLTWGSHGGRNQCVFLKIWP